MSIRALHRNAGTTGAGQAGLTLLEVIIAIIILSVATVAMINTSSISVTGQTRSKVYGDASTASKEVLENLRALSLDSLSRLDNALMPHSQGNGVRIYVTAHGVTASDVDSFSILDTTTLRRLVMNTQFKSKAGDWVTKSFSTIMYKP